jgi:hypothetical protein
MTAADPEEQIPMLKHNKIGRRDLFRTSAGIIGGALLSREEAAAQPAQRNVNTNSSPSALKITDLRVAVVAKPGPSPCPIVASTPIGASPGWARFATAEAPPTPCF